MNRVFKIALEQRPTNLEIDNLFSKVSLKTETQ
jgi:seryl-tRNA synthetase